MQKSGLILSILLGVGAIVLSSTSAIGGMFTMADTAPQWQRQTVVSSTVSQSGSASQRQVQTLTIDREALNEPHSLTIRMASGGTLRGQMVINGQSRSFSGTQTIDLAPYLTAAENTIDITGTYSPQSASVQIALDAPSTSVQYQAGGTGLIDYRLVLQVD